MSTQSPFAAELNPASEINRPMITLSIMLATVIQALDGTIANVALPHMQGNLSASQDQITWVLTSFIVAAAIAMPLTGWLCDRFGQKNVFLSSVAGFTLASVLCGLSGSLAQCTRSMDWPCCSVFWASCFIRVDLPQPGPLLMRYICIPGSRRRGSK